MEEKTEVNLSQSSVQQELLELINTTGQEYKKITPPVEIEVLTEPREIEASPLSLYYSDGAAPNVVVPAGTILESSRYVITPEQFAEKYEEYCDGSGNVVPGTYREKIIVMAMKNPFDTGIAQVNINGFVIYEYDADCYFYIDVAGEVRILDNKTFETRYQPQVDMKKNNAPTFSKKTS